MNKAISYHDALIYTMVIVSASDRSMDDSELQRMGEIVNSLPIFEEFEISSIVQVASDCGKILDSEDGLKEIMSQIAKALPEELYETAYALAVDVAAADLQLEIEELRVLQLLRNTLNLDRLATAAIERGARARFQKLKIDFSHSEHNCLAL